jgi:anti-anti-sigma factor
MAVASFPFQILGGVPVVTAPAEIDSTSAGQLRAMLLKWGAQGHTTIVVDMAGAQFCDPAGMRQLALAHHQAAAEGGGLRLVTPADSAVLRVVTMTGLDRLVPCYARREDALSQAIAAAVWNTHAPQRATARAHHHSPSDVA